MKKLLLVLLLSTGLFASQEENNDNNTDDYAYSESMNSDDEKKRLAHENSDNEFSESEQTNKRAKGSETIFRTEEEDIDAFLKILEYQKQENESKETDNHISLPPTALQYTDSSKKPYECKYEGCNYRAKRPDHLKTHIKTIHIGEKLHICSYCNKTFSQKSNLSTHIKSKHTDEKSLKCTYQGCNYSAIYPSCLEKHAVIHTGEKNLKCTHQGCNYSFGRLDALKRHKKTRHPQESDDSEYEEE